MEDPEDNSIDPAPDRSQVTWTEFLHAQAAVACDFFPIDTALLRRYYVVFFIHVETRQVFFAGLIANPGGAWTTQAARNLFLRHGDQLDGARALVRDRGSQFIGAFDEIFRVEGFKILKTPVRTPVANAFAERWIGSIRRELLDHTIIWNRRQLERLIVDYIAHYNEHAPTAHSSNGHRRPPPTHHTALRQPSRRSERHDATDSSTNTEMQPDQERQDFRAPQGSLSPAAPPDQRNGKQRDAALSDGLLLIPVYSRGRSILESGRCEADPRRTY